MEGEARETTAIGPCQHRAATSFSQWVTVAHNVRANFYFIMVVFWRCAPRQSSCVDRALAQLSHVLDKCSIALLHGDAQGEALACRGVHTPIGGEAAQALHHVGVPVLRGSMQRVIVAFPMAGCGLWRRCCSAAVRRRRAARRGDVARADAHPFPCRRDGPHLRALGAPLGVHGGAHLVLATNPAARACAHDGFAVRAITHQAQVATGVLVRVAWDLALAE